MDLGLLMITVEGILNSHVLAQQHYQDLYGKISMILNCARAPRNMSKTFYRLWCSR
ncbi:MAG: hypothetical protein IPG06_15075 [Haliea sp.]|nr:hypothetical protein [Haliea sp.]